MAISNRARELVAEGRDVISFGAGEPDFPTPKHIVDAAVAASYDPANHKYTSNVGLEPLRNAIVTYTKAFSGVDINSDQIVVTNGAKQAIFQTFAALLDPDDEVLLPTPHWVTYPAGVELAGGVPVPLPTSHEDDFKIGVEQLEAARTSRTRLLAFVSPSNPTGTVYSADEARAIGDWARDNDVWVVADEIYQRLVYDGSEAAASIADVTNGLDNVVLINGVAKSFAMTGWRLGWMIGPSDIVGAAARHQSHATSNVNNIAQMAGIEALNGPQDTVDEMREAFDKRRQRMVSMLATETRLTLVEPQGAFYVFPNVEGLLGGSVDTSASLATLLIEEAGIAVVAGESFGSPGHIRLSYALADHDMERGVERMLHMFGRI